MTGKRKSPEREAVSMNLHLPPGTPCEVQAVQQLISEPEPTSGATAGEKCCEMTQLYGNVSLGSATAAEAKCRELPGIYGHPKDGPVKALPWKLESVSFQKWKECGYRTQNNVVTRPFHIGFQKIPQEDVQKMHFPDVYLNREQKKKIKTKLDLIATGIHPRYQEALKAFERVQKTFQEIIATCNKCGIKQGEIEEFLNYVAKTKEDAAWLGIKP